VLVIKSQVLFQKEQYHFLKSKRKFEYLTNPHNIIY